MEAFSVVGGKPLNGTVTISGAKNAALPILFACLLCRDRCRIQNVPQLRDVASTFAVLQGLGVDCQHEAEAVIIHTPPTLATYEAPYELVRTMRASILALGPLLARFGQAVVSLPGGCAIGVRPVDIHADGLRQMGAEVEIKNGSLVANCQRLHGADITLPLPTVTGTENLLMAAVLAEGQTILRQAACEPEIVDLANFLIAAGANIQGAGTACITIEGTSTLTAADYTVMPDRIEAGTYLAAVAAVGGEVLLAGANPHDMERVLSAFAGGGVEICPLDTGIRVKMAGRFSGADAVTAAYPGFPTDMQAQLIAANCISSSPTAVSETVFENRFMHVQELLRMGADITLAEHTAFIRGVDHLTAAPVMATDLRASASLVIAALAAKGTSTINRIYHLDRGYERMEEKLSALGAEVERIDGH
ncbi:MAG: UDP-N-acetylglucosamine 1-carboxyvinyltransferase [Proteobacteria bacterium]|nr:UDP-N-acetylglucosamine 1-carboxyvinyltransferase [Pseudomonadota bacterium]